MTHELGTNSNKYGALSRPDGVVTVNWSVSGDRLHLHWAERGGPPSSAPIKRGFGTTLIEQSAKSEGGSARLSVHSDGLSWEIELALPRQSASTAMASEAFVGELPPATAPRAAADPEPSRLTGKRFLVVEDEPLICMDIIASLEAAGATVAASAGSAEEALSLIESTLLDAALLDANLRDRPVDDIAAALARANVPFLFVTGYGPESLPKAFASTAMLAKPFSQDQLRKAAMQLFDRPGSLRRLRI